MHTLNDKNYFILITGIFILLIINYYSLIFIFNFFYIDALEHTLTEKGFSGNSLKSELAKMGNVVTLKTKECRDAVKKKLKLDEEIEKDNKRKEELEAKERRIRELEEQLKERSSKDD